MAFTLRLYRPGPFIAARRIYGPDGQFAAPRVCPKFRPSRAAESIPMKFRDEVARFVKFSPGPGNRLIYSEGRESRSQGSCIRRFPIESTTARENRGGVRFVVSRSPTVTEGRTYRARA